MSLALNPRLTQRLQEMAPKHTGLWDALDALLSEARLNPQAPREWSLQDIHQRLGCQPDLNPVVLAGLLREVAADGTLLARIRVHCPKSQEVLGEFSTIQEVPPTLANTTGEALQIKSQHLELFFRMPDGCFLGADS